MFRRRRAQVGTKEERSQWRFVCVGGIAVVLSLTALTTHPDVISLSNQVQKGVAPFVPRSLVSLSSARGERRLNEADCFAEHEEFCADEAGENICLVDDELEGACCQENDEDPDNFDASEICITNEEETCPPEDLCVAELVPASGKGAECLQEFEKNGGIPLYIFLLFYLFIGIAIVCDDYFAYALDQLGEYMGLSSDVKGATFAAIGSSAPELFVSLADNVISNPPKSVGVGTIVGSAIFNILVIIGASAVVAGRTHGDLKLSWKPLARDSLFYLISIAGLVGVAMTDDQAEWYEGLILLMLYGFYLLFMKYNAKIFAEADKIFPPAEVEETILEGKEDEEKKLAKEELTVVGEDKDDDDVAQLDEAEEKAEEHEVELKKQGTGKSNEPAERRVSFSSNLHKAEGVKDLDADLGPYWECLYALPQRGEDESGLKFRARIAWFIFCYPFNILFRLTVPDSQYDVFGEDTVVDGVTIKTNRKWAYWAEFIMCVVHIGIFSHFLVFAAARFGCLAGIAPSVMGLTVLAVGTSIPDMITSIILTGQGEGDGAVANSLGSNVLNILVGLGGPWFLAGFIYGNSAVATDDIIIAIVFLVLVLVILIGSLMATNFHLNKNLGYFLLMLYVLYVIFELFIRDLIV